MNVQLKYLLIFYFLPISTQESSNATVALSWLTGLFSGGIGTGAYLYSSYKPDIQQDFWHNVSANNTNPITIFVHGYQDNYRRAYQYINDAICINKSYHINQNSIIESPALVTFNFADAGHDPFRINRKESSMAQNNEIERLFYVITKVKRKYPTRDIILVGVSRGASTIINLLAFCPRLKIKAVILESPFGHLGDIVNSFTAALGLDVIPGIYDMSMTLAQSLFPSFDKNGIHPIDYVDRIPKNIPVLIVASSQDRLVPISSSYSLYEKLIVSNHHNVYFLSLDYGDHAVLLQEESGQVYQDTVHAFYKTFGLPFNQEYATRGEKYLEQPLVIKYEPVQHNKFHYF